ncbi:alpha-1B adrenergic receptor-like isoform X2 [Anopheles stephensi]|uniref:alpha-1B adrenergic receptor-like isoform X2 n=1 Tax=Anopheles stephensi TaxID=30069 RepID=UPI0016587762|nr:alpha-1B adrenergic receptor-like isoform X2 [Anopheles stephensi]
MVPFQLEILAVVAVLIGIVVNSYIVVIVILTKQITFASKILLLHLGVVNAVLCLFYLLFYAASLFRLLPVALDAMDVACLLFGLCFNTLHSIALWTLCALNFDRYFAIATPLHYGTFINTKKVLITLGAGWIVSTLFSLPQAVRISAYKFDSDYELCLPNLQTTESLIYSISFVLFTILLPIVLILGCNLKVLMIARYQRNRIASAILEVTLSAQLTITHQRNPFFVPNAGAGPAGSGPAADCKPYTQASNQNNPAANVIQLVGSAILFHCPYYFVILWNSVLPFVANGWRTPALLLNLASFLLLLSPTINAILYGVRSKIVRRSFRNIWRKQKQKIEIHYEIQARTPSTCGSRRPSLSGTQFQQQQLQQQQQPLLLAFAAEASRPSSASGATAPDTRSEIGLDPDGSAHDATLQSPLGRVKFGSCSALSGPLFVCNPPQHTLHHPSSHHHHHGAGPRPKITITKILTDDDDDTVAASIRSPPPPPSPASPLSPSVSMYEHHGFDFIAAAAVDGGRLPAALVATIPPICTTDNLSVAGQSGAKLHPAAPLSAGPSCLEPKISFRKFSSLQEILGNGTD